jgi:hypothetical protein
MLDASVPNICHISSYQDAKIFQVAFSNPLNDTLTLTLRQMDSKAGGGGIYLFMGYFLMILAA